MLKHSKCFYGCDIISVIIDVISYCLEVALLVSCMIVCICKYNRVYILMDGCMCFWMIPCMCVYHMHEWMIECMPIVCVCLCMYVCKVVYYVCSNKCTCMIVCMFAFSYVYVDGVYIFPIPMYVWVIVCLWLYTCEIICMYDCMHKCLNDCTCVCAYMCMFEWLHVRLYVYMYSVSASSLPLDSPIS